MFVFQVQEFFPLKVDDKTAPEKICDETTQHAMAGLLQQLQYVAEFATGMFGTLAAGVAVWLAQFVAEQWRVG
jgi:hypothetical protein